jgi:transcriptional regulator with XRE-family HTH domain
MPKSPVHNPDAEHFGAIIRRLRQKRGWTILTCARRAAMNANYLGSLEKGGNMPGMATLFEIADVLGIPAWEIVREVEEARNAPRGA